MGGSPTGGAPGVQELRRRRRGPSALQGRDVAAMGAHDQAFAQQPRQHAGTDAEGEADTGAGRDHGPRLGPRVKYPGMPPTRAPIPSSESLRADL